MISSIVTRVVPKPNTNFSSLLFVKLKCFVHIQGAVSSELRYASISPANTKEHSPVIIPASNLMVVTSHKNGRQLSKEEKERKRSRDKITLGARGFLREEPPSAISEAVREK